jgi:hypothetical protein
LALAERGPVIAVDCDPIIAILASANANALGLASRVQAIVGEVATCNLGDCAAWHIDPDRRPGGTRTTRIELQEPKAEVIEGLILRQSSAAIKLAPAARLPSTWSEESELEWISRDGECRQLVVWRGILSQTAGLRRATMLGANGKQLRTVVGQTASQPSTGALQRFIYEPDAAVIAAGLTGSLAGEHGLTAVGPNVSYLTSDRRVDDIALASFEILDSLPFDRKRVKTLLAQRQICVVEVKSRVRRTDAMQLQRELSSNFGEGATLLLAPIQRRTWAILAKRLSRSS